MWGVGVCVGREGRWGGGGGGMWVDQMLPCFNCHLLRNGKELDINMQ